MNITKNDYIRGIVGTMLLGVYLWTETSNIIHIVGAIGGIVIGTYVIRWWDNRKKDVTE